MPPERLVEFSASSGAVEPDVDFDRFFRAHLRPLTGLAFALTGSRAIAEDLAQDALLAAFNKWSRVGQLDNPGAWVRRVVANRSVSSIRRRSVETKTAWTKLRTRDEEHVAIGAISSDSEHVWAAIRNLPRRQAQVITLRTLDHSTVAEIAEVLKISEEAASTHLRRARQTLAHVLTRGDIQ